MSNSRIEELEFVVSILGDLSTYDEHNTKVLEQLIDIINYRIVRCEKTMLHKSLSGSSHEECPSKEGDRT